MINQQMHILFVDRDPPKPLIVSIDMILKGFVDMDSSETSIQASFDVLFCF